MYEMPNHKELEVVKRWTQILVQFRSVTQLCPTLCNSVNRSSYLTYIQSTSWETLGWKEHKLESRLPGEISITSDIDDTTLMAENEEELKSLLMKVKEESEKVVLKLSIQKTKIMASGPITSW